VEAKGRFPAGRPSCWCLFREGLAEIPKEDSKVSDDREYKIKKDDDATEHEDVEAHVKHKGFTDSEDGDDVEAHVKHKGFTDTGSDDDDVEAHIKQKG
jgi:hypothetical protein